METLKLLIPVDFSPTFKFAQAMVDVIQNTRPTEVFLLHVIPATDNLEDLEDTEAHLRQRTAAADKAFSALQPDFSFKSFVKVGPVVQTINNFAVEIGADLVVIGTQGADGLLEFISGSEAQHVARYSAVPVMPVQDAYLPAKLQHILVINDFQNPTQHPPLDLIKTLASSDATMHLLHILQPRELNQVAEIKIHMQEFASRNGLENVEMHLHQENKVDEGVYHFNQDHQMDLVCMGTHARKGLSHLFYGSIAERLINHCSKPVLTYHL